MSLEIEDPTCPQSFEEVVPRDLTVDRKGWGSCVSVKNGRFRNRLGLSLDKYERKG